jgi:Na+/melibiose symporter-like transporter
LLTAFLSAAGTHHRIAYLHAPPARRVGLASTLREMLATLGNPSFVVLIVSAILGGAAAGMRSSLDNYFYYYLWDLAPKDVANLGLWGGAGTIAAVAAAPVVSRALGKKMTMIWFFVASGVVGLVPLFLKLIDLMPPRSSPWLMRVLSLDAFVTIGLALSGLIVIGSMIADVVEDNAAKTGRRAEGLLFAANGLVPKVTAGIGGMFASVLLTIVVLPKPGPHVVIPLSMVRHLGWLFLPVYVAIVSLSIAVLFFYRIDRKTHDENLSRLADAVTLLEGAEEAGDTAPRSNESSPSMGGAKVATIRTGAVS